ncbi:MAG: zinc-ribbon domain-containing protein [Desulfovibrio sp.]
MIICTRCGVSNEDSEPFCVSCGHKLQSARRPGAVEPPSAWRLAETLRPLPPGALGGRFRSLLLRCLEVWVVAAATLGLAAWGLAGSRWWPGVLGAVLGGLYIFLRR